MKIGKRTWGPILLGTVTVLTVCGVLGWYALDSGAGEPELTPLGSGPRLAEGPPVDLNGAGLEELQDLPGIGPVLAERIVAWREENGAFAQPEDVMEVPGVGPALYEDIAPYIGAEQEEEGL